MTHTQSQSQVNIESVFTTFYFYYGLGIPQGKEGILKKGILYKRGNFAKYDFSSWMKTKFEFPLLILKIGLLGKNQIDFGCLYYQQSKASAALWWEVTG